MNTAILFHRPLTTTLFALAGLAASAAAFAAPRDFASPEEGVAALVRAIDEHDEATLRKIFGAAADKLLASGDAIEDAQNRAKFTGAYRQSHTIALHADKGVLEIGPDAWPLPIPLVQRDGRWHFDTKAGEDEILKRRIGQNELAAMRVSLAIVAAEHRYATHHLDADGVPVYAARIISSACKRDGLYWPQATSEEPSPLGELIAAAADEGYTSRSLAPYHGYYYRILTRQGAHAAGGERSYKLGGKLLGGFAVFAYPARRGASGVKSFLANADGAIYSKDLDERTNTSVTAFDPDDTWTREAEPEP